MLCSTCAILVFSQRLLTFVLPGVEVLVPVVVTPVVKEFDRSEVDSVASVVDSDEVGATVLPVLVLPVSTCVVVEVLDAVEVDSSLVEISVVLVVGKITARNNYDILYPKF